VNSFALDTGPLVAFLNSRDPNHAWAVETLSHTPQPLFTCEAVVSEACFVLRDVRDGPFKVMALATSGGLRIDFRLAPEGVAVRALMAKYADVPMSLADACLVRMTEIDAGLKLITFDEDFLVYRRHGRQVIPVVMP